MRFITTILAGLTVAGIAHGAYITPGNGETFTLKSLSEIPESGVSARDDGYLLIGDLTIAENDKLQLIDNDCLLMANGITITIDGEALFNPNKIAYVLPADEDAKPMGFLISGKATIENMNFQGGGILYTGSEALIIDNCNFANINDEMSGYGVVVLSGHSVDSKITYCTFTDCMPGAINTPANLGVNLRIEGCVITNVSMNNELRPFINVTSPQEGELVIRDNELIGNKLEKPGGIGVSNMLNLEGDNKVRIEYNTVTNCSWGLNLIGGMDVRLIRNEIKDNRWDPDDNGGIAATLYSLASYPLNVYAEGNTFENNKWGPCTIGGTVANFGQMEDKEADNYNPGDNIFLNNHFTNAQGVLVECDFCNNTTNLVYAEGNYWNNAEEYEEVARTIFDDNYSSSYGKVDFNPYKVNTGVRQITVDSPVVFSGEVNVYTLDGVKVFTGDAASISELSAGTYVISSGRMSQKIVIK